jgi:hypothetical protein
MVSNPIGPNWNTGVALLVIGAAGFIAGNFLDAIRDLCIEAALGRVERDGIKCGIKWEFILDAPADKVERVYEFFFAPYVLSANLVFALLFGGLADLFFPVRFAWWAWLLGLFAIAIFGRDAWRFRGYVVEESRKLVGEAKKKR